MNKVVVLLASLGAFAAAAQPANEEVAPPAPTAEMQGRMADMQALMERMRTTKDPAERQRLMAEHMRLMHEGMTMMGSMDHMMQHDASAQPGTPAPNATPNAPGGQNHEQHH